MRRAQRIQAVAFGAAVLLTAIVAFGSSRLWATDATGPVDPSLQARPPRTPEVAVLSVDFDPPLATRLPTGRSRTILVAVDNRDSEPESGAVVEVQLLAENGVDLLARLSEPAGNLAAGEVKLVRLSTPTDLRPATGRVWLDVRVGGLGAASAQGTPSEPAKRVLVEGLLPARD